MRVAVLDTGPLVAFLDATEPNHEWAVETLGQLVPPVMTCEAVISEACFLVRRLRGRSDAVLRLLQQGAIRLNFSLAAELEPVRKLMTRYASVPMSLADACLVRMTELDPRSSVLTLDKDFRVYRRADRHVIPVMMPD